MNIVNHFSSDPNFT